MDLRCLVRPARPLLAAPWLLALAACGSLWTAAPPPPPPPPPPMAPPAAPMPPLKVAKPTPPAQPEDPKPRVHRLASGPPNHVYEIKGETYVPEDTDVLLRETGLASWYGEPFHGRRTATGEVYDMNAMTAAHKTMPLPSYARVRNLKNGREIIVRVNDRGPFYPGRVIDLSRAAAKKLRIGGLAMVEVERITHDEIRTGAWRERTLGAKPTAPPTPLAADVQAARQPGSSRLADSR